MNGFWAQRSPSERRMLVICLIVVAIGVPLALFPGGGSSKKLLSAAEARQQYKSKVDQKTQLEADIERIKPLMDQMVYADPPEQLIPKVITTLQGYAKASGIHLREIKPLRSKKIAGVTKETLSVRFTSEFGKTVPFLYRVEDPSGKLVVEKFNLTASDPKSRTVDVDAQIALYTQAASADATAAQTSGS
jgi:Tfp pilus assembly protein PilO